MHQTMGPARIEAAAAELARQHRQRESFRALAGELAPPDAAAAYRVQDALVAQWLRERKTTLRGYKIALTTPAMRAMLGFHDSIPGRLLADQIVPSGGSVAAQDYGRLIVEFEIAFEMAHDLPDRPTPWTGEALLDCVACAYPALEIADDRGADYTTMQAAILTLAADNAWNQGLVLGAPVKDLSFGFLRDVQGIATISGREVGRGTGKDVLGHPLDALAWLANHLQARGMQLKQGELVTTGSLVKSQFPVAGDHVFFSMPGLGDVEVSVV
jgi:2-keto-4-pentenoate hydratase